MAPDGVDNIKVCLELKFPRELGFDNPEYWHCIRISETLDNDIADYEVHQPEG